MTKEIIDFPFTTTVLSHQAAKGSGFVRRVVINVHLPVVASSFADPINQAFKSDSFFRGVMGPPILEAKFSALRVDNSEQILESSFY